MYKFKPKNSFNKTIVGFNTGHHGGCAVISGNKIVAISEERLNRKKYSEGYLDALFYCLEALNKKISDIDLVVSSSYHTSLPINFMGKLSSLGIPKNKFITVDHHLSHAYTAYFLSPFDEAVIIVTDGLGNKTDTETYYLGNGNELLKVGGNDKQRSMYKGVGRAYETFTNYCGWSAQEAGKTMGLAAYGKEVAPKLDLYNIDDNNQISSLIDGKYYEGALSFVKKNKLNFGKPFSGFENKNAAFFVQDRTEKVLLELSKRLQKEYKIKNVCLAGGVFLNGIVNKLILDKSGFDQVFIPPCCDDTGQPLGNVLYGYHKYYKQPKSIELRNSYFGKEYSSTEYADVVDKKQKIFTLPYKTKATPLEYQVSKNIAKDTAKLLSEGKLVGWFQGSSELGPRALGSRSIISAPGPKKIKDLLNIKVKHREKFRPFAPVILEEYINDYFNLDRPSPFMLLVAKARGRVKSKIPAVLHVDNSGRVQTVNKNDNGLFHELVVEFYMLTGTPVILNTSFNDSGEPIVETPADALNTFCNTSLDYLVMGNYIIWKKPNIPEFNLR